jgi:outer membrane protein OmpA-like peptidoglycan-associated protein
MGIGGEGRRKAVWWFGLCLQLLAPIPEHCLAQSVALAPLHVRTILAVATMLSEDQTERLGFDSPGFVGDLQLGYSLSPWLDVRVGAAAGGFASPTGTGGLLQPQLGAAVAWPGISPRPWLQLDAGAGFTGKILRPVWRASIGVDVRVTDSLTLGPVLGYWHMFQRDGLTYTSDARFAWFGIVLGWQSVRARQVVQQRQENVTHERWIKRQPEPEEMPTPAPGSNEPSPELLSLIESTLPSQQNEWLAPVLFAYNSDTLEPQGVAMLHEVARELQRHPNLKLLEIRGYADVRGSREYNLALSERRARSVLEWLVAHGIQRERLTLAAQGAADFVEHGDDEPAHEQNRRVVFRVLEAENP